MSCTKVKYYLQKETIKSTLYGGNGYNEVHYCGKLLKSDESGSAGDEVGLVNTITKSTIDFGYLNDQVPIPANPTLQMNTKVFRLKHGTITFSGIQQTTSPAKPGDIIVLAITGGTGKYLNIRGQMEITVLPPLIGLHKLTYTL